MAQIPEQHIKDIKLLLRIDSAGACHELIDWCRNTKIDYSVGVDLTEGVRDAIAKIPGQDWVCSLDQDGAERPNGQVAVLATGGDRLLLKLVVGAGVSCTRCG